MALMNEEIERTEAPSPRRLSQAKEQGHWPRSPELVAACVVLTGLCAIRLLGGNLTHWLMDLTREGLATTELTWPPDQIRRTWQPMMARTLLGVLPILLLAMLAAVVAGLGQVGLRLRPQAFLADPGRLNPLMGLQRILSAQTAWSAVASSLKWLLVCGASFWWLWSELLRSPSVPDQQPVQFVRDATGVLLSVGTKVAVLLVFFGLLDYARAWWSWREQMQMSRPELLAELREAAGDPLMRRRRRQFQVDQSLHRIAPRLMPEDLVYVGKGRVAVATRTRHDGSTQIVAKAIGPAADRLLQAARRCGAKTVRDDGIARGLYRQPSDGAS